MPSCRKSKLVALALAEGVGFLTAREIRRRLPGFNIVFRDYDGKRFCARRDPGGNRRPSGTISSSTDRLSPLAGSRRAGLRHLFAATADGRMDDKQQNRTSSPSPHAPGAAAANGQEPSDNEELVAAGNAYAVTHAAPAPPASLRFLLADNGKSFAMPYAYHPIIWAESPRPAPARISALLYRYPRRQQSWPARRPAMRPAHYLDT